MFLFKFIFMYQRSTGMGTHFRDSHTLCGIITIQIYYVIIIKLQLKGKKKPVYPKIFALILYFF